MKESVSRFQRRTGLVYLPPGALAGVARALGPRETCPTLFRYPGPEGLSILLHGQAGRLAPAGRWAWLASRADATRPAATRQFGSLAVLEPLRLQPCEVPDRPGEYWATNPELREGEALVWVPPSQVASSMSWDRIGSVEQAARRLGPACREERPAVLDALGAYLEELSCVEQAGLALAVAWHDVPVARRRRLLADCGATGRWTPR
jgi:hypothetical protein